MDDKLLGLLGLARRAGKITHGYDAVVKDILAGKAALVLLSSDAAARTVQNTLRVCQENGIEMITLERSMEQVGNAIGSKKTAVSALTDTSFAKRAKELCHSDNGRKI